MSGEAGNGEDRDCSAGIGLLDEWAETRIVCSSLLTSVGGINVDQACALSYVGSYLKTSYELKRNKLYIR